MHVIDRCIVDEQIQALVLLLDERGKTANALNAVDV